MTITKQIRILEELSKKVVPTVPLIQYLDMFNYGRVREEYTLYTIIAQFREKKGRIFDTYKFPSDFNELIKHIERKERVWKFDVFYEDSYNRMKSEWESEHPNESFDEYLRSEVARRKTNMDEFVQNAIGEAYRLLNSRIEKKLKK